MNYRLTTKILLVCLAMLFFINCSPEVTSDGSDVTYAPGQVTMLTPEIAKTAITLKWEPASLSNRSKENGQPLELTDIFYSVFMQEAAGDITVNNLLVRNNDINNPQTPTVDGAENIAPGATEATISGLKSNTRYAFIIVATNQTLSNYKTNLNANSYLPNPSYHTTNTDASTTAELLAFMFHTKSNSGLTEIIIGTVNQGTSTTQGTITIEVPKNTILDGLKATWTNSAGSTVNVGATSQVSGTTPNNFSAPVTYVVTSEDTTSTTKNYIVTVTEIQ